MSQKWRRLILIFGTLAGLGVLALAALVVYSIAQFKPVHKNVTNYEIVADTSPEGITRGDYVVNNVAGCADCHGAESRQFPLSGRVQDMSMGPVGAVVGFPNLTPDPDTGLGSWTDAEIARAIRQGVDRDGRELIVMPSINYRHMSDSDVAAVIGYLRSLDPVSNKVDTSRFNLPARMMTSLGMIAPRPIVNLPQEQMVNPAPGTVENGEYLVYLGGCRDCHGKDLDGGLVPGSLPTAPRTPSLISGYVRTWTSEQFMTTLQTGVNPAGSKLDPIMPYEIYGKMDPADLNDIHAYLQSLPD